MSAGPTPTTQRPARPRSLLVTALAWLAIGASALMLPISFITMLMILAGSYGTASVQLFGFLTIVVAPPVTLAAGVGLLLRWRWAWLYMVLLLAVALLVQVNQAVQVPTASTTTIGPDGVRTTKLATPRTISLPIIAVCVIGLVTLLSPQVRSAFRQRATTMQQGGSAVAHASTTGAGSAPPRIRGGLIAETAPDTPDKGGRALVLAVIACLALAGGAGWMVAHGLSSGEIYSPTRRATSSRMVSRHQDPAMFWVVTAFYAAAGAGCLGLAAWGMREGLKLRRPRR